MTDEKRGQALLENTRRRAELYRDITILDQKLKKAGSHIERLGRALSDDPSAVRLSVRAHAFELPGGVSVTVHFDELRCAIDELQKELKELASVESVLAPKFGDPGAKITL